ncbi:MAG TPA: PIG-L family deacetylase [Ktedonobacteraceae bacterium]|jgi:LmbE family N-acetylglucosaminyl deacetylase|nr:PIG-L family deacetylase [Ktedonobacteraceae bacterium]
MYSALRLLGIFAHPDDESLTCGGTLARYAHQGVETSLIFATRGERGWFGNWRDYPGERALGSLRETEVRNASKELGVSRLDFLDYIDGDVDQANEHEIIAKIVRLLRQIRPHIVITFGPEGLYGHPDHIAISQFTASAILCAADQQYPFATDLPPHRVSKLYYRVASEAWFTRYMPVFGDLVMQIDGQERRAQSWTNWTMTTRIDASAYWSNAWRAVLCHKTQFRFPTRLQSLSEQDHRYLWGTQEYYRVFSLVNGGRKEEHDLFEGLTLPANLEVSHTIANIVCSS